MRRPRTRRKLVAVSFRRQLAPALTIRTAPPSFATHALIVVASLVCAQRERGRASRRKHEHGDETEQPRLSHCSPLLDRSDSPPTVQRWG